MFRFGPFTLDPDRGELEKNGHPVRLQPQPTQLLSLLVSRAGQVVTRDEIQRALWNGDTFVDFDQSINFCIKRIRDVLGDDPASPRYIETVPKKGYRFLADLRDASFEKGGPEEERPLAAASRGRRWAVPVWALALLVAGAAGWLLRSSTPDEARPVTRLQMSVRPAEKLDIPRTLRGVASVLSWTALAFSPDGTKLVYVGSVGESSRLFLRRMDEADARPIAGTEGGLGPFFSPDGRWVGFWADGKLMKVPLEGAPPVVLCETRIPFGASWGEKGGIIFSHATGGLLHVSAEGGEPLPLTELDAERGELSHRLPHFLPGGEDVLFTVRTGYGWKAKEIQILSLRSAERSVLIENAADGRYAPTGHLLFARLGVLMAVPFDLTRRETAGGAVAVIDGVSQAVNTTFSGAETGAAQFAFSHRGVLAYVPGGIRPDPRQTLVWVDRNGNEEPLNLEPRWIRMPRISPDGARLAVTMTTEGNHDIWLYDFSRATLTRLTSAETLESWPLWTPDGTHITFSSQDDVYWMPWDGSGVAERLTKTGNFSNPASWTPDGTTLAFLQFERGDTDVWLLPKGGEPQPLAPSPFEEQFPVFSPDGRWLAYTSNETGREEVYVRPYPGPGAKVQISSEGGTSPLWARNGKELFYCDCTRRDRDGMWSMMAVDVAGELEFRAGKPRFLFRNRYYYTQPVGSYDVSPDGERFLMVRHEVALPEEVTEIQIVLDWFEELKRLVPAEPWDH